MAKDEVKIDVVRKYFPVSPLVSQTVRRDLGKYGGFTGVNKFFHLLNAIDHLIPTIGEHNVIEAVNKKLQEYREFEERTGEATIYRKIKSWSQIQEALSRLRPELNKIQFAYDDIREKDMKGKSETRKVINYRRMCRKISPYQLELYFIFNLLISISDIQRTTIPAEAYKTAEIIKFTYTPFSKPETSSKITKESSSSGGSV